MRLVKKQFQIRPIENADLEFLCEVRSDESVFLNLHTISFISLDGQKRWHQENACSTHAIYLLFEGKIKGELYDSIGYVRITEIDQLNNKCCIGLDIHPDYQGNGFSKQAYYLIQKLCFEYLNMNKLWLSVIEYNKVAIALYEKMGFKKEGVLREDIKRCGDYVDNIIMSKLYKEYEKTNSSI